MGAGDPSLTEEGRDAARRAAALLAERPLVEVWASDLRRAVETASLIAAPHRLSVRTSRALRELDFGAWEGRDLRKLWDEEPAAAHAWEVDITETPASFAESVRDLEGRVAGFWNRVTVAGEIAVVAHRGSLAAVQSLITGARFAESFRFPLAWVEAQATRRRPGRSAIR